MTDDQTPIDTLLSAWREAVAAGDPQAIAELVTPDAEFWSPGQPALHGRDAAQAAFASLFERYSLSQEFRREELVVLEDWAFMRGLEVNRLTDRASGKETTVRQRAFSVMRRDADGTWRFHRGMTSEPPADA